MEQAMETGNTNQLMEIGDYSMETREYGKVWKQMEIVIDEIMDSESMKSPRITYIHLMIHSDENKVNGRFDYMKSCMKPNTNPKVYRLFSYQTW